MKIFNKTKQLFGIKEQDVPTPSVQPINKEMKQEGETYKQFGFRSAGLNVGSIFALIPSLHAVYLGLKKEQEKDIELQKELKRKQQTEITNKEAERQKCQNNLQDAQGKLQEIKESIEKKGKEIEKLESESHRRNRPAWIQLVISSVLLIPFTIYFFVFYSSVAYSAFFQDFDTSSIGNDGTVKISYAIFNSKALLQAWNDGFTEVMLILLMPFIFLVFGYVLYRWECENGKLKYIKIPALIILTFIFDSLLSYEICEKIYNVMATMQLGDVEPYSFGMAFQDPRFWIIIFLGFVSYLLWGILFGYFIKALDNLYLNKITLKNLQSELKTLEDEKVKADAKICELKNRLPHLDAEIANLKLTLNDYTRYDLAKIKLELNNFYTGWQQYLASLGKDSGIKTEAHTVFTDFMKEISAQNPIKQSA